MAKILKNKTDVIVVGGGPAGISAAVTIARGGKKVILIERGNFAGAKNVFGGAIYAKPTREIFPNFEETAPLERKTVEHKYAILTKDESTVISHRSDKDTNSYTVERAKFDRWLAEEAKKEGVIVVTETLVKECIVKDGVVVGVRTELEDYYSDIVILADGVNSLLARQVGLRKDIKPKDVALGVKEVIKLDQKVINERFNLKDDEGCVWELFGGEMLGMLGLGYIYTNKNSVVIGFGVALDELIDNNIKSYELLDKIKAHPTLAPLIEGGELLEYSAHLIPEGGFKKVPKVADNGVMIVGDAAMLVNNLHWEGTNLAMISGKLAGETALNALKNGDFSENSLDLYRQKLENSFIMKDLKSYKNLMSEMHKRRKSYLKYYPEKISEFFKTFVGVDSIPKREKFRNFIKSYFTDRSLSEIVKDAWSAIKVIFGVLK